MTAATATDWRTLWDVTLDSDAVTSVLRGRSGLPPSAGRDAVDRLIWVFQRLKEEHPARFGELDEGLAAWFDARLREGWDAVRRDGLPAYTGRLIDALDAARHVAAPLTHAVLRERVHECWNWFAELAAHAERDPCLVYVCTLARIQPDRRFLGTWYRLCEHSARERDDAYREAALRGLRALPHDGDGLPPEAITGLVRWARHLPGTDEAREVFLDAWRDVTPVHRDAGTTHAAQIDNLMRHHAGKPFVAWWAEVLRWEVPDTT